MKLAFRNTLNIVASVIFLMVIVGISEALISYTSIPVPSALFSIFLLFLFFLFMRGVPVFMRFTLNQLLSHMGLFLVPSVVIVLLFQDIFLQQALALFLVIVVSTLVSLGAVGWVTQRLVKPISQDDN